MTHLRTVIDTLFAWPDVALHLLIGGVVTAAFFGVVLLHRPTLFSEAWQIGRAAPRPGSRARRNLNRISGLIVLVPLLVVIVLLVAYLGWSLAEFGWLSAVFIPAILVGLWMIMRALADRSTH